MDKGIQNQTSIWSTTNPPTWGEKSLVNFGLVITEIWRSNRIYPNRLFWKTIFWPIWYSAPPNFLTLENDQILLAHTPPRTGVTFTIFFKGGSKIGLKFIECLPLTSRVAGVASQNFATWCGARWGW